jgi:hypothetical protein
MLSKLYGVACDSTPIMLFLVTERDYNVRQLAHSMFGPTQGAAETAGSYSAMYEIHCFNGILPWSQKHDIRVELRYGTVKFKGVRGSVVVKALCYKPEGRGFETRRGE